MTYGPSSKVKDRKPLVKNKDGYIQSKTEARANILNEQFVSAFTRENTTYIPDMGQSEIPSMSNITVDWKGFHTLMMNLKTKKTTGQTRFQPSSWKQLLQN